jgi:hypothetical protein
MVVVEIEELPKKITWIGCLREPIYDAHHNIIGMLERGKHKAYVKRGFTVSPGELTYMDSAE